MNNGAVPPKKKMLIISSKFMVGGVERALLELLNAINSEYFDITLLLTKAGGELEHLIPPHIKVKYLTVNLENHYRKLIRSFQLLELFKSIYCRAMTHFIDDYCLNTYYAVQSWPKIDECFDIVIAYKADDVLVASLPALIDAPKKILWVHAMYPNNKRYMRGYRRIVKYYSHIFCVSNSIKKHVEEYCKAKDYHVSVINNLLDIGEIRSKAHNEILTLKQQYILTVGRLSPEKGQQMIPATARMLVDAGYDIYWYLVGDGPLREEVEREIEKYGVADRVILLGMQSNPYPYIKNCDIYVQPSFSEGWGLTVQEARILRKPIVTTPVPAFREQIVSGENGLIVDAMTPESLFEGIKTLLDHPELREKFVKNLEKEDHDNSKEMQKLYDFIES